MNRTRILILLFAIGCAVVAAFLARNMLSQQPAPAGVTVTAPPSATVSVLVAAKDIAVGEALNALSFEWRDWPRGNVASFMITRDARPDAVQEFDGARARSQFYLGEPIAERKIVKLKDGGLMSSLLPKGLRGIAVRISDRSAVSGFILPNDRVDIIATLRVKIESGSNDREVTFTRTIVTNARVLAINQNISPETNPPGLDQLKTAVLELDPDQAEIVALSEAQGEISLILRSIQELAGADPASQRPEFAPAATEDPSSISLFTPSGDIEYSCEGNCIPRARGLNSPFPLTFRDRIQKSSATP
jgi:pilus assembly protein CpaB